MTNSLNVPPVTTTAMSSIELIGESPKKSAKSATTSRFSRKTPQTSSIIKPISENPSSPVIKDSEENIQNMPEADKKQAEQYFMSLNRVERRKIEKRSHVKIPGTNIPFVNLNKKHG